MNKINVLIIGYFKIPLLILKKYCVMLDEIKGKAADLLNDENIKGAVDKAKEFLDSEKGKEIIENVKEKAEDFLKDKLGK